MWFVYILKCSDNSFYTGITNNLQTRFQRHKEGKGAKYMRGRSPFKHVYTEEYASRSEALKREYQIKSSSKEEKAILICHHTVNASD